MFDWLTIYEDHEEIWQGPVADADLESLTDSERAALTRGESVITGGGAAPEYTLVPWTVMPS